MKSNLNRLTLMGRGDLRMSAQSSEAIRLQLRKVLASAAGARTYCLSIRVAQGPDREIQRRAVRELELDRVVVSADKSLV